jgi:hypothetical protein
MLRWIIYLALLAALVVALWMSMVTNSVASWGPMGCSTGPAMTSVPWMSPTVVTVAPRVARKPVVEFVTVPAPFPGLVLTPGWYTDDRQPGWHFYLDGQLLWTRCKEVSTGKVYDMVGGRWQCQVKPKENLTPKSSPGVTEKVEHGNPTAQNFGVDVNRISQTEGYSHTGDPISREEAFEAVQAPKLPDEAEKFRLVIIGDRDFARKVKQDLGKVEGCIVQSYPETSWVVRDRLHLDESREFGQNRRAVVLQDPTGKALHVQYDWSGPADAQLLREVAVDFDKIKDLRKDKSLLSSLKDVLQDVEDLKTAITLIKFWRAYGLYVVAGVVCGIGLLIYNNKSQGGK